MTVMSGRVAENHEMKRSKTAKTRSKRSNKETKRRPEGAFQHTCPLRCVRESVLLCVCIIFIVFNTKSIIFNEQSIIFNNAFIIFNKNRYLRLAKLRDLPNSGPKPGLQPQEICQRETQMVIRNPNENKESNVMGVAACSCSDLH